MVSTSLETKECAPMKRLKLAFSALALLAFSAMPSSAQQYKYETPMPPGVASPDKVET
jgi:hypothetical protein